MPINTFAYNALYANALHIMHILRNNSVNKTPIKNNNYKRLEWKD